MQTTISAVTNTNQSHKQNVQMNANIQANVSNVKKEQIKQKEEVQDLNNSYRVKKKTDEEKNNDEDEKDSEENDEENKKKKKHFIYKMSDVGKAEIEVTDEQDGGHIDYKA